MISNLIFILSSRFLTSRYGRTMVYTENLFQLILQFLDYLYFLRSKYTAYDSNALTRIRTDRPYASFY